MSIYYKAAFCVYTANTFTTLVRAQRRRKKTVKHPSLERSHSFFKLYVVVSLNI